MNASSATDEAVPGASAGESPISAQRIVADRQRGDAHHERVERVRPPARRRRGPAPASSAAPAHHACSIQAVRPHDSSRITHHGDGRASRSRRCGCVPTCSRSSTKILPSPTSPVRRRRRAPRSPARRTGRTQRSRTGPCRRARCAPSCRGVGLDPVKLARRGPVRGSSRNRVPRRGRAPRAPHLPSRNRRSRSRASFTRFPAG